MLIALWMLGGLVIATERTHSAAAWGAALTFAYAAIMFIWFLLVVPLALLWFATRPKENVRIYGPQGQQVTVTEEEARKRVEQGWSYQENEER